MILYIQLTSLVWYWLKCVVDDFVLPTFDVDGVMDYSSFAFNFSSLL